MTFDGDWQTWHNFSLEWVDGKLFWFIDGIEHASLSVREGGSWPFDKPFYLIINVAVGGRYGCNWGSEDWSERDLCKSEKLDKIDYDDDFESALLIDYIRVRTLSTMEPPLNTTLNYY